MDGGAFTVNGVWLATHVPGARHRLEDAGQLSLVLRFGDALDELLAVS